MDEARAGETLVGLCVAAGLLDRPAAAEVVRESGGRIDAAAAALIRRGVPADAVSALESAARRRSSLRAEPSGNETLVAGAPVPRAETGRRVGPYEILAELGRGGMGVVHRARHSRLGRIVALKTLPASGDAELAERFLREARAAARLGAHPNVVQVHDAGEDDGVAWIAMELVEGRPFDRELREGGVTPRRAAEIAEMTARALAHAHAAGVVHRDVKPGNILVARDGTALLADFGLARDAAAGRGLSVTGQILGTPAYMSPEQAEGRGDAVGPASDVWSLGATLYEALAGRPPFEAPGFAELLSKIAAENPAPPSRANTAVPRDLDTVCLAALRREPALRYPSASAMADDLRRFLDGLPVLARRPGALEMTWARAKRRPVAAALALAAALLAVGGILVVGRAWRERRAADREGEREEKAAAAQRDAESEADRVVATARARLDAASRGIGESAAASVSASDFAGIAAELRRAIELAPARLEARILLARACRLARQPEEAFAAAEEARALSPGSKDALYERTLAALDLLRRASGYEYVRPFGARLDRISVQRFNTAPDFGERVQECTKGVEELASSGVPEPQVRYCRAKLAEIRGDFDAAIREFDAAIAADPFFLEAWRDRVLALAKVGKDDDATLKALERVFPGDPWVLVHVAQRAHSPEERARLFERAASAGPNDPLVLRTRGHELWALGRKEEGFRLISRAVEIDPASLATANLLMTLSESEGDYDQAFTWIGFMANLDRIDPHTCHNIGAIHQNVDRWAESEPWVRRAVAQAPEYPHYRFALGLALAVRGEHTEAARELLAGADAMSTNDAMRKAWASLRPEIEKRVLAVRSQKDAADLTAGLLGLVRLRSGGKDASGYNFGEANMLLTLLASLREQSGQLKEARQALREIDGYSEYDWAYDYRIARCWAREGRDEKVREMLLKARVRGMKRLGAVRMDSGFAEYRNRPAFQDLEREFESAK